MTVRYLACLALGYLIGSLSVSILISKYIFHQDVRTLGSGNAGAANAARTLGPRVGALTLLGDFLKGIISMLLGSWLGGTTGLAIAGAACMIGHCFPIYFGFKGGKGFLVCFSTVWFIDWRAGLIAFGVLALLLLSTKYMSLSTMLSLAAGAVSIALFGAGLPACLLYTAGVLFVVARHHENIRRLVKGTESRFFFGGKKKEN